MATELRRELRQADLERYRCRVASALPERREAPRRTRLTSVIAAGLAAGLALIASGEIMHRRSATRDSIVTSSAPITAPPAVSSRRPDQSTPATQLTEDTRRGGGVPGGSPDASVAPHRAAQTSSYSGGHTSTSLQADVVSPQDHRNVPAHSNGTMAAVDRRRPPTLPAVFESNRAPMLVPSGPTAQRSVLLSPGSDEELQVMMIADDGAKNFHVQPSPDGQRVAFDSDRDGERGIFVANRDGSDVHRVSGPGYAVMPSWSPDSKQLADVRPEADNRNVWNLWLLKADSGDLRRLTQYRSGRGLERIVVRRRPPRRVRIRRRAGHSGSADR